MAINPAIEEVAVGHGEEVEAVAGRSPSRIAFDRLRRDKVAVVCAVIVFLLVLLALLAPVISRIFGVYWDTTNPNAPSASEVLEFDGYPAIGPPFYPFTWDHPLGLAPRTGSDNLAYMLTGLRTSLGIALMATIMSTLIGVVVGLLAGFSRGWLDRILSFVIDLFLSFPALLGMLALAPIVVSRFGKDIDQLGRVQIMVMVGVLVFFGWMSLARLVRGQVLSLREREFVQAAQVIGVPKRQILFKELLPNLVAPIVISLSLSFPAFIALEAGLSFLGLGLTDTPSLGKMVSDARSYWDDYPLYLWLPVGTIALLTLALNLLGDAVRDAFDPKTRR